MVVLAFNLRFLGDVVLAFVFFFLLKSWACGRGLLDFLNHLLLLVKCRCVFNCLGDVTYGLKLLVLDKAPVPKASYGTSSSLPSLDQAIFPGLFGLNPSLGRWD